MIIAEWKKEDKDRIITALHNAGAVRPCPRCRNAEFSLLDGYFSQPIQTDLTGGLVIGGPTVPSVVVVCNRCGFMAQHAVGALGLLKQKTTEEG